MGTQRAKPIVCPPVCTSCVCEFLQPPVKKKKKKKKMMMMMMMMMMINIIYKADQLLQFH